MIEDPIERSKFEELVTYYLDYMLRVAEDLLGHPQDAEDAVQEALLSLAESIHKVDKIDSTRTRSLVTLITERRAITLYHRKNRLQPEEVMEAAYDLAESFDHAQQLSEAMATMPSRYRAILLLKYYHGYSIKECARELELTPQTAGKLEQRAKNKLLKLCRERSLL